MCDTLGPPAHTSPPLLRKSLGVSPHASNTVCPQGTVLSISSHRKSELKGRLELIMVFYFTDEEGKTRKINRLPSCGGKA